MIARMVRDGANARLLDSGFIAALLVFYFLG